MPCFYVKVLFVLKVSPSSNGDLFRHVTQVYPHYLKTTKKNTPPHCIIQQQWCICFHHLGGSLRFFNTCF